MRRARRILWSFATAGVGLLAVAGSTLGLPGDPAVTPISPTDGAEVATNPDGIAISYGCPTYGRYTDPLTRIIVKGFARDYSAVVSSEPTVGPDGRLARVLRTTSLSPLGPNPQTCSTSFGGPNDFSNPLPHRTPGPYYWQVSRPCPDCATGHEVGPVWKFTVRLRTELTLRAPKVAYAGYPFLATVRIGGGATGDPVRVESIGPPIAPIDDVLYIGQREADEGNVIVSLKAGVRRLRAAVTSGTQTVTSSSVAVTVKPATRWATGAAADGRYRDVDPRKKSLRLRVTDGGKFVRGFHSGVVLNCTRGDGVVDVRPGLIDIAKIPVAPDGSFVRFFGRGTGITQWVQGRVRRSGVVGYASLGTGGCSGDLRFSARRR